MITCRLQEKMKRMGWALSRLFKERRGVAAVEFALIAPLLLAFYFLTMEFSQAIDVNRKVGRLASQVGDLVTQQPWITASEVDAIMTVGEAVIQPYDRSKPVITLTAIEITAEPTPRALVVWSRRLENGQYRRALQPGSVTSVPSDLMVPDSFLIRAEADLNYLPVVLWTASGKQATGLLAAFDKITMGEHYYLRPRQSRTLPCSNC
jgi:Flp pilus assembly protein TadG